MPELGFPEWASTVADAVVRAARGLAAESYDVARRRDAIPYELVIRRTEFVWRFSLAHKKDRIILFFFEQPGDVTIALRTEVRFTIAATARVAVFAPDLERAPVVWEAVVPRFVILNPDAHLVRRYAGDAADPAETTLLRLDDDGAILAVVGEDDDALVIYTTSRGAQIRLDEDPRWEPVLALLGLVRSWVESDGRTGLAVPEWISAKGPPAALGDTLRALIAGYKAAEQRLVDGMGADVDGDVRHTEYAITDFHAEVDVRLDEDGHLVTDDDDTTTQVSVAVDVHPADERIGARVTLTPSDFFVRDALRGAIVAEVARGLQKWRTEVFEDDRPSSGELGALLHSPDARTFTFRVERTVVDETTHTRDRNIVVWDVAVGGARRLLVVDASLEVNSQASPPTAQVPNADSLTLVFHGNPSDGDVPDVACGYAARYVVDLRRALKALR